jgi:hypothetical protein
LGLRTHRQPLPLVPGPHVGEQSCGILVEVQEGSGLDVEHAARLLLQLRTLPNLDQQGFKGIERL